MQLNQKAKRDFRNGLARADHVGIWRLAAALSSESKKGVKILSKGLTLE